MAHVYYAQEKYRFAETYAGRALSVNKCSSIACTQLALVSILLLNNICMVLSLNLLKICIFCHAFYFFFQVEFFTIVNKEKILLCIFLSLL